MTTSYQEFSPRWASPPGATISESLADRGIAETELRQILGMSDASLAELLNGNLPLTICLAEDLATHVGGTPEFWMTRDCQYRDDVARLKADEWAQSLPFKEMVRLGWVDATGHWREQLEACLDYFGVDDVDAWNARYGAAANAARFRTSPTFASSNGAVAAWMRQGEKIASKIDCSRWSPDKFRGQLDPARRLTWRKDPAEFIPRLTELFADAGVAFAVAPAPKGCSVSGVARFLDESTGMILLSARHLSDDHFWFTLFHEAGHLLLHDSEAVHIDDLECSPSSQAMAIEETEADDFASDSLVDLESLARLAHTPLSYKRITSFAKSVGVAPGVVVGQLQHRHGDRVGYHQFNNVKRRYKWVGSSLEKR